MAVDGTTGVNSDRNYLNNINSDKSEKPGKVYNAVFANGDEDELSISDFFDLMILQLTNQDFMNPVDDTQYLTQMAQFATMQEMMDLAQFSKQNYVMSMLGKEVTVSNNVIGGKTNNTVGRIEKITMQDGEFKVYVDGKPYDLSKVIQVQDTANKVGSTSDDDDKKTDEADKSAAEEIAGSESADNRTDTDTDTDIAGNDETIDSELAAKMALADG